MPRLSFRLITIASDEQLFEVVARGMRDAASSMGVEADLVGTPGFDLDKVRALVRQAIVDRVDGIGLNIFHATALASVVAEAHEAGIPTVAFNIDAGRLASGNLSYVMQDFVLAGAALGRRARTRIAPEAQVIIAAHDASVDALEQRAAGILQGLGKGSADVLRVVTGRDPAVGAVVLEREAARFKSVAILGTGQPDTEAAGMLATRHARRVYAAGFDLSPGIVEHIRNGYLDCTVDQQPYAQGFYPIVQLTLLRRYGLMPPSIDAGRAIVDRTNVEAVYELTRESVR